MPKLPAKRRKVSAAKSLDTEDSVDVGPASESREQHLRRHNVGRTDCPRCRFYSFGAGWKNAYGAEKDPTTNCRRLYVWVQERPARFPGQWAVGCFFCNNAVVSARCRKGARTGRAQASPRLCAKWSRHEIRPASLQSEHFRKHAFSQAHKCATAMYFAPDAPLVLLLQKTVEDEQLLQGAVPQLDDWLRVWRTCREPQSWLASEKWRITERYISQLRKLNAERRALQSMTNIAREVTRAKKRDRIRPLTYISYAFDERDGDLLLRYRCDVPPLLANADCATEFAWGGGQPGTLSEEDAMKLCHSSGIIGVSRTYFQKDMDDMNDEYTLRISDEVISMIRAFCTPLGDTLDEHLFVAMKSKCISVAVDGKELNVAKLLRQKHMPNMIIVCRDASHAIRIACRDALVRTGGFQKLFYDLFKKKGALLKSIDHSLKLKAELEACQKFIVDNEGHQGGGLKSIMNNFSYATHRWESKATRRSRHLPTRARDGVTAAADADAESLGAEMR